MDRWRRLGLTSGIVTSNLYLLDVVQWSMMSESWPLVGTLEVYTTGWNLQLERFLSWLEFPLSISLQTDGTKIKELFLD